MNEIILHFQEFVKWNLLFTDTVDHKSATEKTYIVLSSICAFIKVSFLS